MSTMLFYRVIQLMCYSRGEGTYRGDFSSLNELFLVLLQFPDHSVEGLKERDEFFRARLLLRNPCEISHSYLLHSLLHVYERSRQKSRNVEGDQDSQNAKEKH